MACPPLYGLGFGVLIFVDGAGNEYYAAAATAAAPISSINAYSPY
jgi:hypothetical protein